VTARKIDMVAAWSIDRLGRSMQHLVGFLGELEAVGCDLYLHQQALDTTTPSGRAMFQMCGVVKFEPFRHLTRGQLRRLSGQMGEFRKLAASGDPDDRLVRNAKEACFAIAEAVRLGYLWAQTEAEFELKPLARLARRVKDGAISGGAKSGERRRQNRAWLPIAKEMAKDIRAQNPTFSQDDVATEIDARWKDTTCRPPRHPTLKGLISEMEKATEETADLVNEGPSID
jgi:hypothetical protein